MYPWKARRRASACAAFLLALAGIGAAQAQQTTGARAIDGTGTQARTLILSLTVDGHPQAEPIVARRVGDEVMAAAIDLRAAGIAQAPAAGDVALSAIPGLRFTIDEPRQQIDVTTGAVAVTSAAGAPRPAAVELTPSGWGGFVNYDVAARAGYAGQGAAGSLEGVIFTPRGHAFAGAIAAWGDRGPARLTRTDIGYTVASPESRMRATVGDFINGASGTSRPIRMTGIRVGTDFSTRPDLVTFPLPGISGSAAVPSSVDLVVNGDRQAAADVGAGAFAITDLPVRTGLNTLSVTTRDALGRTAVRTVTTYASPDLLRAGLSAFSAELGLVRTGYLTPRDRYRALAASGSWRRGLSDTVTLDAHAEGTSRLVSATAGALVNLGWFGLANASLGMSTPAEGRAAPGTQIDVGLQRIAHPVSLSLRYQRNSRGWGDVAGRYGAINRDHTLAIDAGFDLARLGTLGIGVLGLGEGRARFDWRGARVTEPTPVAASTLVNATYSVRLGRRISLLSNLAVDTRRRRSLFAAIGAVVTFGARTSGYASANHSGAGSFATATVNRAAIAPGDWGYRAGVSTGIVGQAAAAVQHLGRAGLAEAGVEEVGGRVGAQLSMRGSLVHAQGRTFAAETLTDSFAVVDTAGQRDVPIYRDNHRVGVTDAHGLLVVPDLAAYQETVLSIEPTDIDTALTVSRWKVQVRPARQVGVHVGFDMRRDDAVLFTLVDDAGTAVTAGSHGRYAGADVPVGLDGQAFFSPGEGGSLLVQLPGGQRCAATVPPRRAIAGPALRLTCLREGTPPPRPRRDVAVRGPDGPVVVGRRRESPCEAPMMRMAGRLAPALSQGRLARRRPATTRSTAAAAWSAERDLLIWLHQSRHSRRCASASRVSPVSIAAAARCPRHRPRYGSRRRA